MITVNLSSKELSRSVNYLPFQSFTIDNDIYPSVNFHIATLLKEVKQTPKRELRSIRNQIVTFLTTASAFLMSGSKSMASELATPVNAIPKTATGVPPELMELMIMVLTISVTVGIILAAILLVLAGMSRMLGKKMRKDATEWTTDILKGLTQVLLATPLVFLLYYVATLLFKSSGWFVSPF